LTIKEIRALSLKYEHIYSKKNKNKQFNQNEETAFFAGGFKGKCNNCGSYGHKLRECRNKKKTTTRTTRTTEGTETRTMTRSLSCTSVIIARKKCIWQRTVSRRSAIKNRRVEAQTELKTKGR
jgi:hypothetical protein